MTGSSRMRLSAAAVAVALLACVGVVGAAADPRYPVNWDALTAAVEGAEVDVPPPGANVPCQPDSIHPDPVVLVHGIMQNQNGAWQALAPILADDGYCVFTLTYGKMQYSGDFGGIGDLVGSAGRLHAFVDDVLARTGAAKLDLVGYSEGGFISRRYLKTYGRSAVRRFVGISAVNSRPATISGLLTYVYRIPGASSLAGDVSPAFEALSTQPAFTQLNEPSSTFAEVTYTSIATTSDSIATPYRLAFLPPAPNVTNVTNVTVQQFCPEDRVGHLGMPYDRTTVQLVRNALDPAHERAVPCGQGLPI